MKKNTRLSDFNDMNKKLLEEGMSNEELIHAFEIVLAVNQSRIIVSKSDIEKRINRTNQDLSNMFLSTSSISSPPFRNKDLEMDLLKVWQEFFSVNVSLSSKFTDLGGDSISAIELADQIKTKLGLEISPYLILEKANVETLANFLQDTESEFKVNFVQLQDCSSGPLLICVHPGHGAITQYRELFLHINVPLSIYAIENDVLHGKAFESIIDMATYYVDQLCSELNVEQGILLAGWSLGGTVAHFMAKLLLDRGISVHHLSLFDPWALYTPRLKDRNFFDKLQENTAESSKQWLDALWHYTQCLIAHEPPLVSVDCTLIKANKLREEYVDMQNEYNHWGPFLAGEIEVFEAEGDHQTMMQEPCIAQFARCYEIVLQRFISNI